MPRMPSLRWRACKPVGGWLPIEVGFGLTERGRAGAEAGMACEVGGGAGAGRDHGDRGRFCRIHQNGISFDVIRFIEARSQQDEWTKGCTLLNLVASLKPEGQMVSHTSRWGTDEVLLSAG